MRFRRNNPRTESLLLLFLRGGILFFLVVPWLFLCGCSNRSIFTGLDAPDTEKISRYTGEKLLNTLELNQNSEAFYRELTVSQRERILSTLDSMIQAEKAGLAEGELSLTLPRSANAAVELLIHTDSIVYDIIYNLADPALSALSLSGITIDELYVAYTDSVRRFFLRSLETGLLELATAFYNLYRISIYYQDAVDSARYGVYSGADLQTYVLAGVLGGLIQGTEKVVGSIEPDYDEISMALSQAYHQLVSDGVLDWDLLNQLYETLAAELDISPQDIILQYKAELDFIADIFEAMALNAGYELLSQETTRTIRSWGE